MNILLQQAGERLIVTFKRKDGVRRTSHFASIEEAEQRLKELGDEYTLIVH